MPAPRYPSLYQINACVWLTESSPQTLGRRATLHDISDAELDREAEMDFDWVWFLSVWQTGSAAQQVSRSHHDWCLEFQETLPDLREENHDELRAGAARGIFGALQSSNNHFPTAVGSGRAAANTGSPS